MVPLYPLAEWIAFSWWQLFENSRPLTTDGIDQRSMRSVGDGFLWPDLAFMPAGESMRVSLYPLRRLSNEYLTFDVRHDEWVDERRSVSG